MIQFAKQLRRLIIESRPHSKGHSTLLLRQYYNRERNVAAGYTDQDHLAAAADWLKAAQDATRDGGISGRYSLQEGWTSSYPETTGYIIPTLLALGGHFKDDDFLQRARTCVEFLLSVQLESGAFPGGEIAHNRTTPSPFNTAQIICGLLAWYEQSGEDNVLQAAVRAGEWLVSVQDDDGAFRKYFYHDTPATYSAYASCWLAKLGQAIGREDFLTAAKKHLHWTLQHLDPTTQWIDKCGFDTHDHERRRSVTHTLAYTLDGVLITALILGDLNATAIVRQAAERVARRLELSKGLPGIIDSQWRGCADYKCLTGNAQMAIIWFKLHQIEPDGRLLNAALKAIDEVKLCQSMTSPNPGVRGGIPGSDPIWGAYISWAIPNWAAKYFVDALLMKADALAREPRRRAIRWEIPSDVCQSLPPIPTNEIASLANPAETKVVLYTSRQSAKVGQITDAWTWFRPAAIVIEETPSTSLPHRLHHAIRGTGLQFVRDKFLPPSGAPPSAVATIVNPVDYATRFGIPYIVVPDINCQAALDFVQAQKPDLAVHAGAGILRHPILQLSRLGTLNAHMGILPYHRGINVVEWSWWLGHEVGCTVHLIDRGIDTGDIVCAHTIDASGCHSIAALRQAVDHAQIELLGEVVHWVIRSGKLPNVRPQHATEGVQFFRMHGDLIRRLERLLEDSQNGSQKS